MTRCDKIVTDGIETGAHYGAQLCVVLRDGTRVEKAWGEARVGTPMTSDHAMLWLSASKPLAPAAIGILMEEGRLDIGEPVCRHIPEFAQFQKEKVTIQHLLTHTVGLRSAEVQWCTLPWDESIRRICACEMENGWPLGQRAAYHISSTWMLLGEIVRRISGLPYDQFVASRIFAPAGMAAAYMTATPDTWQTHAASCATVYTTDHKNPGPHPFWNSEPSFTQCRPGAGARGPIRDLATFYRCLVTGGAPILQPATVDLLTERWRRDIYDETFLHRVDWGLGFLLNSIHHGAETVPYNYGPHASTNTYGHSGSQSVCGFADPLHGIAVAWAFNGLCGEPRHQRRQRALNTAIYEDLDLVGG